MSLLQINHLNVRFTQQNVQAVRDVSLNIAAGEVLALVGESGSGKSVTAAAILGLLPARQTEIGGEILFNDIPLLQQSPRQLNRLRGHDIAMVFQNSQSTLDPAWRIGKQLQHNLRRLNPMLSRTEAKLHALDWLIRMKLPHPQQVMNLYPHQLSGGMRQRILIALAAMCQPKLLIADEPSTALDSSVQREVLHLLKELCQSNNMAMLLITHDFGVVAALSDRVAVMRDGCIVETAATPEAIRAPRHPYTQSLLAAVPYPDTRPPAAVSKASSPLLQARQLGRDYIRRAPQGLFGKKIINTALDNVSLDIYRGEIIGVIGESGSGKSTLARILAQLIPADRGEILFSGQPIHHDKPSEILALRRQLQCVFQDSLSSFNPRLTLEQQLVRPQFRAGRKTSAKQAQQLAVQMFNQVGLDERLLQRYPHQLSGGQRQRANIARALVVNPQFLLLDEPTSALDLTVQAQVMALLTRLHQQHHLTCLFISHNLALVSQFCHRILVTANGKIVDDFSRQDLYHPERHAVTQRLLAAHYPLETEDVQPQQIKRRA